MLGVIPPLPHTSLWPCTWLSIEIILPLQFYGYWGIIRGGKAVGA
jgi:hypothetical protein